MRKTAVGLMFALLAFAPFASANNFILNGDFEQTSHVQGLNGKFLDALQAGEWDIYVSIPGWNRVAGAGIEIQNGTIVPAHSPTHYVELDSNDNSAMEQVVSLAAGDYILGFWYRPRTDTAGDNTIWAKFDGGNIVLTADSVTGRENFWKFYSVALLGVQSGPHSVVISADGINNSLGGFVDDVSLTAVPEPASMLLLGTGLFGLAGAARRRLRK